MQSFGDVINAFQGAAKMAEAIGDPKINSNLIRQWGYRDSIPSSYWPTVVAAAERNGIAKVTLVALVSISAKPSVDRSKAPEEPPTRRRSAHSRAAA